MKLYDAQKIAARVIATLAPFCERIEVAGSVRRRKPEVGDIEIVCIPRRVSFPDLLGVSDSFRDKCWSRAAVKLGRVLKGDVFQGKYILIALPDGIDLDIFTATAENWGLIYAIRTGSADFSHRVLASGWSRRGYVSKDGMITKGGVPVIVREEWDLFTLAGVKWVSPEERR